LESEIKNIETDSSNFKSWITFPTGNVPMYVKVETGTNELSGTLPEPDMSSGVTSQYDELHYIRAMHAWVDEGSFCTEDLTIQGKQSRVDGIEDIFFDYDSDNGLLTVYVLARGNQKNSDFAKDNVQGWPQEISNSQYRLVVTRGSLRIRN